MQHTHTHDDKRSKTSTIKKMITWHKILCGSATCLCSQSCRWFYYTENLQNTLWSEIPLFRIVFSFPHSKLLNINIFTVLYDETLISLFCIIDSSELSILPSLDRTFYLQESSEISICTSLGRMSSQLSVLHFQCSLRLGLLHSMA